MLEHIWPIGLKASEVPQECECTFDPISPSESILSVVNVRCPCHGADAQRRTEKIALYGLRYGTSGETLMKQFEQERIARQQREAERKKKRRQRWLRIWHNFVGHSHDEHYLDEEKMEWRFVCECGHATKNSLEDDR